MTEKEDVSPCYFKKQGNLEPLNTLVWSRFTIFPTLRYFRLEVAFKNQSQFSGMFYMNFWMCDWTMTEKIWTRTTWRIIPQKKPTKFKFLSP